MSSLSLIEKFNTIKSCILARDFNAYQTHMQSYGSEVLSEPSNLALIEFAILIKDKKIFMDFIEFIKKEKINIPENVKTNLWLNVINYKDFDTATFMYHHKEVNFNPDFFNFQKNIPTLFFYAYSNSKPIFNIMLKNEPQIPVESYLKNKKSLIKYNYKSIEHKQNVVNFISLIMIEKILNKKKDQEENRNSSKIKI